MKDPEPLTWEVTREQIAAYADASGDRNPIHLDESAARAAGLPGVIAHGMLGMAHLARFVVGWTGDHRRLRRLRCRFSAMMLPGDLITFSGRVTGLKEGLIQLEIEAENQKGERVLTKGLAEVAAS